MTAKTNHPTNGDASVSGTTTTGQHHHPEQQQQQQQQQPTMQPSPPHASQSMLQPQIQPPPPQASPKSHYTVEESSVIMEGMLCISSEKERERERERAQAEQILHSLGRFIIFLHPYQPLFFFFHLLPFPMLHCLIFVRHFVETGISLWQELA